MPKILLFGPLMVKLQTIDLEFDIKLKEKFKNVHRLDKALLNSWNLSGRVVW